MQSSPTIRCRWKCATFLTAFLLVCLAVRSIAQPNLELYPIQSIYPVSTLYSLTVYGHDVTVTHFRSYEIAQFGLGKGTADLCIDRVDGAPIRTFRICPRKLNCAGAVSGSSLAFDIQGPRYLIVKIDNLPELVIAIDPPEKNPPHQSGDGVLKVTQPPYSAAPGPEYATSAIQHAIDDASAWGTGQGDGKQGVAFVPAGLWTVGSLHLGSNVDLYLASGAVLRYTGEAAHYDIRGYKTSQHRNLTWLISTSENSSNISITGRGTIDGNGQAALAPSDLGVNLLVADYTSNFHVDGITFREASSWGVVPLRSRDVVFTNVKIFNSLDMGENDGIDVVECSNVRVDNAIGIALDDPFSTKTWGKDPDIFKSVTGDPLPLNHVSFRNLLSWTRCYGLKVGQGVEQPQNDVSFEDAVVYDAAVGIGIHHKWGSAPVTNIRFENIDIERLTSKNDGNRTWMALWVVNTPGPAPISGVTVKNIDVYDAGTTPARINGMAESPIQGVTLQSIRMPDSDHSAGTLTDMHITDDTFHDPIEIRR